MLYTLTKIWSNNGLPFYALIIYVGFHAFFEHLTGFELDFVTSVLRKPKIKNVHKILYCNSSVKHIGIKTEL